jgi:hypothetical protein
VIGEWVFAFGGKGKSLNPRSNPMKKYLIAAALIVGFAAPALAEEFYIMYDKTAKKCVTMKAKPADMSNYELLGTYPTLGGANTAMPTMTQCK